MIDQEANCRNKIEAEMARQARASIHTEGKQDQVTGQEVGSHRMEVEQNQVVTVETLAATSGSASSSPLTSVPSSSSSTLPPITPGGGVGTSPGVLLDDSGVCSSAARALPSPSLPPPPPPPTPEQERRHSLVIEGSGESGNSSVTSDTSGVTSVTTSGSGSDSDSDISGTSSTTRGDDGDVSATGGTNGTTSGSDSSGSGFVAGVAAGLSGGKTASGREEESRRAATAATAEPENLDPGIDQSGAAPKALPPPAAVAIVATVAAAAASVATVLEPITTVNTTTTAATTVATAAAATTATATPPRRQGRVQPWRFSGGSSASDSSKGVGDGAGVSDDGASGGDPTKDCASASTPASGRVSNRSGNGRVVEKIAESASSAVGLSKSPPYLAGAAAATTRAKSVPSAVFVDGCDGGGREGAGLCRQAERGSVALNNRKSARSGKVPLPFLGDAPIRRVASF